MAWHRSWTGDLGKVGQRSWSERFLASEALIGLLLAGVAVRLVPFKHLASFLGLRPGEGPRGVSPTAAAAATRVGWALGAVASRTPGYSTCLVQALAGTSMLRRRSLPATVYLGTARGESAELTAHAWLRCGEAILTGRHKGRFVTVAAFTTHQDLIGPH